jgi:hypothetical protein
MPAAQRGRTTLTVILHGDRIARRGRTGPAALAGAVTQGMRDGGWMGWRRVRGNGVAAVARALRPHAEAAGQAAAPRR